MDLVITTPLFHQPPDFEGVVLLRFYKNSILFKELLTIAKMRVLIVPSFGTTSFFY